MTNATLLTPAQLRDALRQVGLPGDISNIIDRSFIFEIPVLRPEDENDEAERDRFIFGKITGGRIDSEGFLSLHTNIMDIRGDQVDEPAHATPIMLIVSIVSIVGGRRRRTNPHWGMRLTTNPNKDDVDLIPGTLTLL